MAQLVVNQIGGLNLYVNPLNKDEGQLIKAVNVESYPYGAKSKRPGYTAFLGTADGSAVKSLFSFTKEDGTTLFLYRASGSSLYYSAQGTGDWTLAGNGTIGAGSVVHNTVLADTLFICDGVGSTRHTTNGTTFTNTTLAPVAMDLEQYQRRVYAAGTSSTLFYSTTNDGTNWNLSGTSDSSSFTIPGAGKLSGIYAQSDKLITTKTSGLMYQWDGYALIDTATHLGPSSHETLVDVENNKMYLNRLGVFLTNGGNPQLLSNPIQREIYNNSGSAIVGVNFDTAPGGKFRYNYFISVGTITDDFTNQTINNAIIKYDYQKNEFLNYTFANNPTAYTDYRDNTYTDQFIFGDANGQCYKYSGTATSDNGVAINSEMIYLTHCALPHLDKQFRHFWGFLNPGNEVQIQYAVSNTYINNSLNWKELGDCSSGVVYFRFPQDTRGKILYLRVYESSRNSTFNFYGFALDYEPVPVP